jgi:dihydroorotate dehydrogenase
MLTKTNELTPAGQPSGLSVIAWFGGLRTRLRNLRHRKTARAYRDLTNAMKRDPDFAHTWQCNIACPLMDAGMNHAEANAAADRLMRHLFGVVNYTEPNTD